MDNTKINQDIRSGFENLMNGKTEGFEKVYTIESEKATIKISGSRNDNNRWGVNKYAVDANVSVERREEYSWTKIDSELEETINVLKSILSDTIGYTGPIRLRSGEESNSKQWVRRIILTNIEEN